MPQQLSHYTLFKGTLSEYKMLHKRINTRWGSPKKCDKCPRTEGTRFDWANISGNYDEFDKSDWMRLCRFCHMELDSKNFEGKRFTGKKHTAQSRLRISISMKKYWEKNRSKMMAVQPRGERSGRYKHGRYCK